MTIPSKLLNQVVCMDALALMAMLPDGAVDAIITDLPYGTTACTWDTIIPFEPMWAAVKRVLKPRGVFVTTASQPFTSALVMSNPKWFRYEWVWEKTMPTGFLNAHYKPLKSHENILVFSAASATGGANGGIEKTEYTPQFTAGDAYVKRKSGTYAGYNVKQRIATENDGFRYPTSIIKIANPNADSLHDTQKPVALYEYLIRTYTQADDVVLDFCCGSGTTALAARNTGRRYIVGDSSAEYVDIATRRLAMPYTLPMMFEAVQS